MTAFTDHAGVQIPLICGAMYPCSNPELVAAVSDAGGLGIVQPITMVYAHGRDLRDGLREIRTLTDKPIGFNALVEASSKVYQDRMRGWVDVALEEGVRFFVTALGKPDWVVKAVHAAGGVVYHDVTERHWADKALASGVDGLICVNRRAGGHAGSQGAEELLSALSDLGVPLVCAGGIGDEAAFAAALDLGYAGVQMGTRFIATDECTAHADYKQAIVQARAEDIVLTDRISGVPVAVIETEFVRRTGTRAGPLMRRLLRHPKLKHYARLQYTLRSVWQLKRSNARGAGYKDYFQAGKSVSGVHGVEPAGAIVRRFAAAIEPKQAPAEAADAAPSPSPPPREPRRGRTLVDKLGLKSGLRAVFVNAPEDYATTLGTLPDGLRVLRQVRAPLDFIHVFSKRRVDLLRRFPALQRALADGGTIWVSWPKKASKVETDLSGNVVRVIGLSNGLVDVKVCAVDAVWSGLKFVRRTTPVPPKA